MQTEPETFRGRRVLKDAAAEAQLNERGYALINLLNPQEVDELVNFYLDHASRGDLNPEGAYNDMYAEFTTMNSREDFRPLAFDKVSAVAVPRVAEHVIDFRPLVVNYVNKSPGKGVVPVHQNMSVVDETRSRSISVWIALCDCNIENGTLQFVDGSHLMFRGTRGTWAYQQFAQIDHDILAQHLRPVEISAGQAIVLDDAVIHYSPPNHSPRERLAIQLVMAPVEEPTIYFEQSGESANGVRIDALAVDQTYFFQFWEGVGVRRNVNLLRTFEIPRITYEADDFLARLDPSLSRPPRSEPSMISTPGRRGIGESIRDRVASLWRRLRTTHDHR